MKSKDIIKQLMQYPEFEVYIKIFEPDGSKYGMGLRSFEMLGIGDISYMEQIIHIDIQEI